MPLGVMIPLDLFWCGASDGHVVFIVRSGVPGLIADDPMYLPWVVNPGESWMVLQRPRDLIGDYLWDCGPQPEDRHGWLGGGALGLLGGMANIDCCLHCRAHKSGSVNLQHAPMGVVLQRWGGHCALTGFGTVSECRGGVCGAHTVRVRIHGLSQVDRSCV